MTPDITEVVGNLQNEALKRCRERIEAAKKSKTGWRETTANDSGYGISSIMKHARGL